LWDLPKPAKRRPNEGWERFSQNDLSLARFSQGTKAQRKRGFLTGPTGSTGSTGCGMISQIIQYRCPSVVGSDLPADRDYSDFDFDSDLDLE
jgi:hypothetical protein